jgi:hypothetical protein
MGAFHIEAASGAYVDLMAPDPTTIGLDDVAWHLATTNRYCGAARRPISVAEHALLVAEYLSERGRPAATVLGGLHHDDHEAYMGDINAAVKNYLGGEDPRGCSAALRLLARRLDGAIATALELPPIDALNREIIHDADLWALAAEAYYLMPSRGVGWGVHGRFDPDYDDPTDAQPRLGLRRLALNGPPNPHAIAAEWAATHHRWLRLHKTTAGDPREEQCT